MIRGEKTGLRARHAEDVPLLHAELYDDVPGHARADTRPWVPWPAAHDESPYAVRPPGERDACFSVVELATGELAGEAVLWDVDLHNRGAHLGLALRPAFRGRGLGGEVVRLLCHYGFTVRGLHRLQLETLADNAAMIAAAKRNGFIREGVRRSAAWVHGEFLDELVLGLLADEWTPPAA
ncbi:GNAT family N-acetyltransferase [Streptomyces sp. NPDC086023]|uniref:GNAT family N-acetyltransferase n=1 Tax=Streptomyces sp. NPDC086023 TaxID=3365746 RepID=UPI0037CD76CE